MSKLKDREALRQWEIYKLSLQKATTINLDEDLAQKQMRISYLSKDFVAFCKYYFPQYVKSPFAKFHLRFAKAVIENNKIFITRHWARAHAKSVMAGVLIPLYLKFTGQLKNMILVSFTEANAQELLKPIMLNLEANQRIINDFGPQKGLGNWETGRFITTDGCSFRAVGRGQNPRGTRNEEARPDFILVDDIDDDEACKSTKRLDDAWDWLIGALYGCFDISGAKRFLVVGNIIATDSLALRAQKQSDNHDQINILDKNGQPSWKERFSLEECNYMISKMGYRMAQREYFNNPINEGKVFKKDWIQFKPLMPLRAYKLLFVYLDPGFKKTATSDSKAMVLIGQYLGEFHIIKAFVGQASIEEMIEWGYEMHAYVNSNNGAYRFMMEEVFLQSLLYKDFAEVAKRKNQALPVVGDKRKKPDKDARIEALEGYFERGQIFFNSTEEHNHHMKELINQFLCFEPGVKTKKDGPDAVEGGIFLLNQKVTSSDGVLVGARNQHKHRI
jgi:hypothetical protein